MARIIPTQFVLYDTDAVDVSYSDGSSLQLSPCGSSFVWFCAPEDELHPLHDNRKVQQRTQYVTSRFRTFVSEALDFRNRFSERQYLCPSIIDAKLIRIMPHEINEITWKTEYRPSDVKTLPDGSKRLESLDGYANVTLAPCRQSITVCYLAQVSEKSTDRKAVPPGDDTKNTSRPADHTRASTVGPISSIPACSNMSERFVNSNTQISSMIDSTENKGIEDIDWSEYSKLTGGDSANVRTEQHTVYQCTCVWTTKHYSVLDCPETWQHPLQVVLKHDARVVKVVEETSDGVYENETNPAKSETKDRDTSQPTVSCSLPDILSLNCKFHHLHKFKKKSDDDNFKGHGKIKVVCVNGIIYKMITHPLQSIEIYPGDGSVMRSSRIAGHYFDHFYMQDHKVLDKTYSVQHPPPKVVGAPYNIGSIITTGARLLELFQTSNLELQDSGGGDCCWKVGKERPILEPISSVLLEEYTYPGLGKFRAYSSGRVRILFEDRTALDMNADFSHRISKCAEHSDKLVEEGKGAKPVQISDIPPGMCRLFLPNGNYCFISTSNPGQYDKYVQSAVEWVSWVNTTPSDRYLFYKDTIHDPEKMADISKELTRINCFNFLLEHQTFGARPSLAVNLTLSDDFKPSRPIVPDMERLAESATDAPPLSGDIGPDAADPLAYSHSNAPPGDFMNMDMIKQILMKNSQTVQEIDTMLNQN